MERYRIGERIGAGGMGEVRLGEDTVLGRLVALKFLPEHRRADLKARARLQREARSAAALDHPYICKVYEVGEREGRDFIAMEYVRGTTLAARLERGPLPAADAVGLALEVAEALELAHNRQILHRDLKPANLMLTEHGHVKVMDFGLAKSFSDASRPRSSEDSTRAGPRGPLTETGVRTGTPAYMSPEQIRGEPLDARSDFFSFGIVLYEMLTGSHPFRRASLSSTTAAILEHEPPFDVDALTGAVGVVLQKLLAKDRELRYLSALDLRRDLARARDEATGFSWIGEAPEPAGRTPLVAREKELSELMTLLERAHGGTGSLVLLGGEPGVGKTRLAEAVVERARESGAAFFGRCHEEGSTPFVPFVEMVEQLARALPPHAFRDLLGDGAPEIARIVPELRRVLPDIPRAVELSPDQHQRFLFASFVDLLSRVAGSSALVLVLDDVHWADAASLALVQQIAGLLDGMRILIIGTYRDEEVEEGSLFEAALAELVRQRRGRLMPLKRLAPLESDRLVQTLLGAKPPDALSELIYRETNGNAFFVEELVRHLSEEGKIFDEEGRLREISSDELEVPEGVRLVITRRLSRLSEPTRAAMTAASVIGLRFSSHLLEPVAGLDEDAVIDVLEEAEKGRLVRASSSGRDTLYAFEHALVQHTLQGSLSLARRQRIHRRIADALEAAHGESRAADIVYHLRNGGSSVDTERFLRFLLAAAERANASTAFHEALEFSDEAEGLLGEDDAQLGFRGRWLFERGVSMRALGRWHDAVATWYEGLPLFERLGDRSALVKIGNDIGFVMSWFNRWPEVIELIDRILPVVGQDYSFLPFYKSIALVSLGQYEEGVALNRMVVEKAQAAGDEELRGAAYFFEQCIYMFTDQPERNVAVAGEAAKRLAGTPDVLNYIPALAFAAIGWLGLGRLDEVKALYDEMMPIATRVGHFGAMAFGGRSMAFRELMRSGNLEAFASFAEEDLAAMEAYNPPGAVDSHGYVGLAHFFKGDWEEAKDHFEKAAAFDPVALYNGTGVGWLFLLKAYRADDDALAYYLGSEQYLPVLGQPTVFGAWRFLQHAVDGLAYLGELERAAALYPRVVEQRAKGSVTAMWGEALVEKALGIAAAAGRDWDRAEAHFEHALQQANEIPFRTEQPEVRRWYGWMLKAKDDASRARGLLEEAAEDYRALGMTRHEAIARELVE